MGRRGAEDRMRPQFSLLLYTHTHTHTHTDRDLSLYAQQKLTPGFPFDPKWMDEMDKFVKENPEKVKAKYAQFMAMPLDEKVCMCVCACVFVCVCV